MNLFFPPQPRLICGLSKSILLTFALAFAGTVFSPGWADPLAQESLAQDSLAQDPSGFQLESDPSLYSSRQNKPLQQKPIVLEGQIKTLQQAIDSELQIDWYAWYMACRTYLKASGGFQCAEGTPIYFYPDGHLETNSPDLTCRYSVQGKLYPLPKGTRVKRLILPVRSRVSPPASPKELYKRIQSQ